MKRIARRLLVPLLLLPACAALAQSRGSLEIDIVGGNAAALPIAVVPFGGNCGDTDVGGAYSVAIHTRDGRPVAQFQGHSRAVGGPIIDESRGDSHG